MSFMNVFKVVVLEGRRELYTVLSTSATFQLP